MKTWEIACLIVLGSVSTQGVDVNNEGQCICGPLLKRPDMSDRVGVARWMVHSLDMGVLSTISTKQGTTGTPFGNIYSYVDGSCAQSMGVPYFYVSPLDQSAKDVSVNPKVSLTLSEAFLPGTCHAYDPSKACTSTTHGDPENPVCARLTLSGEWVQIDPQSQAFAWARQALFERHPTMQDWPVDHDWQIFKLQIQSLWFIDYFGGAYQLDVEDYLRYDVSPGVDDGYINNNGAFAVN